MTRGSSLAALVCSSAISVSSAENQRDYRDHLSGRKNAGELYFTAVKSTFTDIEMSYHPGLHLLVSRVTIFG
jgi:hypothetical protein